MYQNGCFEKFFDVKEQLDSPEINTLSNTIKNFYNEINQSIDRCTERYQKAVQDILDTFPIIVSKGIDDSTIYKIANKQVWELNDIITALSNYIDKFESIRYLGFLAEENRNVVFVGPNGAGKTTLLRKLKNDTQNAKIHYYAADRVLLVSEQFNPKRAYDAFMHDLALNYKNSTNIDNDWQGSDIIKQFDFYLHLLEVERNEENEKRIQNGMTQKIIDQWHNLVKDRELFFEHGLCVRPIDGTKYPLKYLSSGEKSILYFLIGILLQEEKDYYFIDEPENNLNPAIVSKLWDFIERERPNSIFVYLTHDSDFVASRINTKIYWIEKYDGKEWMWRELKENKDLPQDLMIKLVGNREPVLFCESHNEYKYDAQLFKLLFPEYKIVSAAGCDKVCALTKAYKEIGLPQKAIGIIDCDYKSQEYLDAMSQNDIYYIPFHEIENFLFCEKIIKAMIKEYSTVEDKDMVFETIKEEIKKLFISLKDSWVTKHVAFNFRNNFDYRGKIKSLKNIEEFKTLYNAERKSDSDIDVITEKYTKLFEEIMNSNNYDLILRHLDYKGLLSKYNHILKLRDKIDYKSSVLGLLNMQSSEELIKELRADYFPQI